MKDSMPLTFADRTWGRVFVQAFLGAAIFAVDISDVSSQERRVIAPCANCDLSRRLVTSIGDADGPGFLAGFPWSVVRDSRGRYIVATESKVPPQVFDSTGRFLRTIGRFGPGPNEYNEVVAIVVGPGDTLFLFDRINARMTVIGPDYMLVRTAPIPSSVASAAITAQGLIVISASINDRDRVGFPLHVFDKLGEYKAPSGAVVPSLRPRDMYYLARRVAASHDGGVWAAPFTYSYEISKWTVDGKLARTLVREVAWFRPVDSAWAATPTVPPMSFTRAVIEDSLGLLWTAIEVPDRSWKDGLVEDRMRNGKMAYKPGIVSKLLDGVVEVIDPRAGRLLGSVRFDDPVWHIMQGGMVVSAREDDDGILRLQVWRVDRPSGR